MRKSSSFERVVGSISEEAREQILQEKGERFDDQIFEELKGKERKKTPEELQIISLVNQATNRLRAHYGLDNFDIPEKNIHIIKEEEWLKERVSAFFAATKQIVAMREPIAKIAFLHKVFHEMVHFKAYDALQVVTGEEDSELKEYRLGLTVFTRNGKAVFFRNLNEAVTEELTNKWTRELLHDPLFAQEIKQTTEIISKYSHVITPDGNPLFDADTFYAEVENKKTWRKAIGRMFGLQEKSKRIIAESSTYTRERKIVNTLIDKIFEKTSRQFGDKEEIFELFAKGMMTGNLLPIGRLVDGTFGKGTLRRIGELDDDIKTQEEFVGSLEGRESK